MHSAPRALPNCLMPREGSISAYRTRPKPPDPAEVAKTGDAEVDWLREVAALADKFGEHRIAARQRMLAARVALGDKGAREMTANRMAETAARKADLHHELKARLKMESHDDGE